MDEYRESIWMGMDRSNAVVDIQLDLCFPFPPGSLKLNIDVLVCKGEDFIGVGLVFSDHLGTVLAACSKRISSSFDVEMIDYPSM